MFLNAMKKCNAEILTLNCCGQRTPCNCENALTDSYWEECDTYNCTKKMDTYTLKYGPAYISEIYHYLTESNILNEFNNKELNIASLGCGFSPDYYAIKKYINTNNLNIKINYYGLDISTSWETGRPPKSNDITFSTQDLTNSFDISGSNIIFLCKSFSTMYRNKTHDAFTLNLMKFIEKNKDIIIIFIDINNKSFGRDYFHKKISPLMNSNIQYYFEGPNNNYYEHSWIKINKNNIVYCIPEYFCVDSIDRTLKTVVFEYRK